MQSAQCTCPYVSIHICLLRMLASSVLAFQVAPMGAGGGEI